GSLGRMASRTGSPTSLQYSCTFSLGLCSSLLRSSGGGGTAQTTGGTTSYGGPSRSGCSPDCPGCIVPATTSLSIRARCPDRRVLRARGGARGPPRSAARLHRLRHHGDCPFDRDGFPPLALW